MINKKFGLMALSLAAMGLVACGGGGNSSGGGSTGFSGELTYWCAETDTDLFAKQVEAFKKANTDFHGTIKLLATVGEGSIKDNLTKDVEKAADVFEMADDNIADCVKGRALISWSDAEIATFRNMYGDAGLEAATIKGKVYGVPYRNDNGYVLSYDKSIISDEDAKDLDKILEKCKANNATFNMNLTDAWYSFAPVWAAGGKTYTDTEGTFHSEIANAAVAKGLAAFANKLNDSGVWLDTTADDGFGASTDRVGAVVKWNNEKSQSDKLGANLGIAPLPSFSDGTKSYTLKSFQGFKHIGVRSAKALTGAKLDWAKKFACWMASDSVAELRVKELKQGVTNKVVIAKTEIWDSKWLSALATQSAAGNVVAQATGSNGNFWDPAKQLAQAVLNEVITDEASALEQLTICETAQNKAA